MLWKHADVHRAITQIKLDAVYVYSVVTMVIEPILPHNYAFRIYNELSFNSMAIGTIYSTALEKCLEEELHHLYNEYKDNINMVSKR